MTTNSTKLRLRILKSAKRKLTPNIPASAVRERLLAKKIATFYLRKLKGQNLHHHPWDLSEPVEDQQVFCHFLRVARLIKNSQKLDAGIDWRDFVTAQFESWNGPQGRAPLSAQLYSQGAYDRYNTWLSDRDKEAGRVVSYKKLPPKERYKPEDKYLSRLAESQGISERKALIRACTDFSMKYLRYKGVWAKVKERYLKFKEGE